MNLKNIEKINIWDLGDRINVKINQEFIDYINNQIKHKFQTKRNIHKELIKYHEISFSVFKNRMKRDYTYFIDLEIIVNLCKILGIDLQTMQENIVAYKSRGGYNYIENPRLPIKITPIFDMLIAHHIGDGNVVDPKRNRKPYFGYRQYDRHYMAIYIKKIESVFGNIRYKEPYKDKTRSYFPTAVSYLLFKTYNLNTKSFLSKSARVPREIFKKEWKFLLAFLLGIIIDDGHVDSTMIVVGIKNKELAKDLIKICNILGYESKYTERTKNDYREYGYVNILKKGMMKLWSDYIELLREYPEVNLGHKGEKIKEFIDRLKKPKIYIKGNKDIILKELFKENLTVNELAKKLNMTRQGARYLIKELIKEEKVEFKSLIKNGNYRYGLR